MWKTTRHLDSALAGLLATALLFNVGCASGNVPPDPPPAPPRPVSLAALCPLNAPKLSSDIPGDSPLLGQASFDCFAWQEFIALNWPTEKNAPFGKPGDTSPVVWETYMDVHGVMRDGAQTPVAWGQTPPLPAKCQQHADAASHAGKKVLRMTGKFQVDFEAGEDIREAAPENQPNWLADRDGNLVWYEILIDKPEYDYIVQETGFYNAETQYQKVSQGGVHVNLPRGVYLGAGVPGTQGAMELKAAWLTVKDPAATKWKRYKLADALVYDPRHDTCEDVTVALVGLHILHKTESQPQWTWATFEHVDNAPDSKEVAHAGDRYTFYRSSCKPRPVPSHCRQHTSAGCVPKAGVTRTSCEPNTSPAWCLKLDGRADEQCRPYPVQVVREMPIPDTDDNPVRSLNAGVQELIRQANPDSVWQHYQLVNVLWSDSAVDENPVNVKPAPKPPVTPLSESGLRPSPQSLPVANAVMETYFQSAACVDCHRNAAIAKTGQDPDPNLASDYSFLFGMAKSPMRVP